MTASVISSEFFTGTAIHHLSEWIDLHPIPTLLPCLHTIIWQNLRFVIPANCPATVPQMAGPAAR
nr:MAG TPA: hypothetical protein [Caudoviricetes sp.]DAE36611.1 MAG TPA: hypothetical protein [Caudoviricetes sp.]